MQNFVSIIIVNYNGQEYLQNCLSTLQYCKYPFYEVIVVDNGSVDNSVEMISIKFPETKVIKLQNNVGYAKANNLGADAASGDLLLFLNNDTLPTPDFLNELVSVLIQNKKIAICQSLLLKRNLKVDSSGDFLDFFGRAYSSKTTPISTSKIFSAKGACMLIQKKIFFEIGQFDELFFASLEDVDLGWRTWIYGYDVVLVPNSIVYHLGSKTISKMQEQIWFHVIKNSISIKIINYETLSSLKPLFFLFSLNFLRKITRKKIINDPEDLAPKYIPKYSTIIRSVLWVFSNWKYIQTRKKSIRIHRQRSTSDLINLGLIRSSQNY